MRGRKHPLEVFRDSGRQFQTQSDGRPAAEPAKAAAKPETLAARSEGRDSSAPLPTRPTPRSWDARDVRIARAGPAPSRAAAGGAAAADRSRRAPPSLTTVAVVLGGLVLLAGGAYAFKLWHPAENGSQGTTVPPLKRSSREEWRDPLLPGEPGGADANHGADTNQKKNGNQGVSPDRRVGAGRENAAGPDAERTAAPSSDTEPWVLVACVKLTTETLRSTWKEKFKPDQERLLKLLGDEFPGMKVQLVKSKGGKGTDDDGMLRIGRSGLTEADAELTRLLTRVRTLFKDAYLKKFKKS